jgi:hypothetical protein
VSHRNAVADGYGVELKWDATRLSDGLLDNLGHFVEVDVARDYFAETVGDTDEGLVDVSVADAYGVQQRPVRCPLKAPFYCVASHIYLPFHKESHLNQSNPRTTILTAQPVRMKKK